MRLSSTIHENKHRRPNPYHLHRHPAKLTLGLRQSDFSIDQHREPRILCFFRPKWARVGEAEARVFGLTFPYALYRRQWYSEVQESVNRKRAALYLRVSSNGQDTGAQETALREYVSRRNWTVHAIYKDLAVSGARSSRPALDELLKDCRRGKFDVLLVWKFDRFARSLKTLISGLELCRAFGIDFVSVTEAIDTSLPHGSLVFQMLGCMAEFERSLIAERVNVKLGLWFLPILTAVGIGSVIQWYWTVLHGAGDLRFYLAVQVYAVLALIAALLLPPRYTRGSDLLVVAGLYVLAKICEKADGQIFSIGHIVSGHTLKHLAAGAAGYWILRMLQKRQPIQDQLSL